MVTIIPYNVDIAIPPAVQEVAGTGALVTPKPFSPLKIKSATGGRGARRALADLGTNNAKLNLSMAHSNLAIAQEEFLNMWNFNPVKEVPVALGRYQWAPLSGEGDKDITPANSGEVIKDITLLKDITNPILSTSPPPSVTPEVTDLLKFKHNDLENIDTMLSSTAIHENSDSENTPDSENRKQGRSPSCETVILSTRSVLSKSQICITDFFQPKKRKSSYHREDTLTNKLSKNNPRTIY